MPGVGQQPVCGGRLDQASASTQIAMRSSSENGKSVTSSWRSAFVQSVRAGAREKRQDARGYFSQIALEQGSTCRDPGSAGNSAVP
jgi:hypothetical protein